MFVVLKICGALRDFVPFVQFKKRVKHPWRSVNFSNVAGFIFLQASQNGVKVLETIAFGCTGTEKKWLYIHCVRYLSTLKSDSNLAKKIVLLASIKTLYK